MPFIKISPPAPAGPLNIFYSISTPTSHNADIITPGLPIILFLHPVYIAQQIFQAQFSDIALRQFNLVAFDMRSHGETQGNIGDGAFMPAEDAYHFMEALKLPPCHIFGLSIGCCVALELAFSHPDRVLSLTLCSPPSPTDSDEVTTGRREVHQEWSEVAELMPELAQYPLGDPAEEQYYLAKINTLSESGTAVGLKQLAFNNEMDMLTSAIMKSCIAQAFCHWGGSLEQAQEAFRATILWPLERKVATNDDLSQIRCPVNIIYCTEDIVYSVENAEALQVRLQDIGLKSKLYTIPGPHYGCVSGAKKINSIVRDLVLSCHNPDDLPPIPMSLDTHDIQMRTPFVERLETFDYYPSENAEMEFLPDAWLY